MTSNAHQRKRAKAKASAFATAKARRIADNLAVMSPSPAKASATVASLKAGNRAFAPNGLATTRQPWGDRNSVLVGEAFKSPDMHLDACSASGVRKYQRNNK